MRAEGIKSMFCGRRDRRVDADEGSLHPVVSHLLPLTEAPQAHRIVEHGHAGGKVVLDIAGR